MRSNRITRMVTLGLLLGILLLMYSTGLGYLRIFAIDITLFCIPVVIATVTMGLPGGLVIAFAFACTSLHQAITAPSGLLAPLVGYPLIMYPSIFLPRLLIPILAHLANKGLKKAHPSVRYGVTAAVGSLTNTVFFLGFIYILGAPMLAQSLGMTTEAVAAALIAIVGTNGVHEAIAAVVLCVPILLALKKALPKLFHD